MSKSWEIFVTSILSGLLGAGMTFWAFSIQTSKEVGRLSGEVAGLVRSVQGIEPERVVGRAVSVVIDETNKKIEKDFISAAMSKIEREINPILLKLLEDNAMAALVMKAPDIIRNEMKGQLQPIILRETQQAFGIESSRLKDLSEKGINYAEAAQRVATEAQSTASLNSQKISTSKITFSNCQTLVIDQDTTKTFSVPGDSGREDLINWNCPENKAVIGLREWHHPMHKIVDRVRCCEILISK